MFFNNDKSDLSITVKDCLNRHGFCMAVLDWVKMELSDRIKIALKIGYDEEESKEVATELCTAVILIPRECTTGMLDYSHCYLHISTLGALINPEDIADFLMDSIEISELENPIILSAKEKMEIMSKIIPSHDMREVK